MTLLNNGNHYPIPHLSGSYRCAEYKGIKGFCTENKVIQSRVNLKGDKMKEIPVPFTLETQDIIIYAAGKGFMGPVFKTLTSDYNINSAWVHWDENNFNLNDKQEIWRHCVENATLCDTTIIYSEPDQVQCGALVELGHTLAAGKPVYIIGRGQSFKPINEGPAKTDIAFTYHDLVHFTLSTDLYEGYAEAIEHYKENYVGQWLKTRHGMAIRPAGGTKRAIRQ